MVVGKRTHFYHHCKVLLTDDTRKSDYQSPAGTGTRLGYGIGDRDSTLQTPPSRIEPPPPPHAPRAVPRLEPQVPRDIGVKSRDFGVKTKSDAMAKWCMVK